MQYGWINPLPLLGVQAAHRAVKCSQQPSRTRKGYSAIKAGHKLISQQGHLSIGGVYFTETNFYHAYMPRKKESNGKTKFSSSF